MKNNSNKYRKFSKNNFKENSESKKIFNKRKSKRLDESQGNVNKPEKNKFSGNKNYYEYQSKNNFRKSSKFVNEAKIHKNNNQSDESNLEDFIWGKHSVLAALESNRPINRIWCTSEIRSSEKFFILLKEIKSKGVLVEEVTWSRISQITRGAVHQGIALQVSYTKTLSLDQLISLSNFIFRSTHKPI